MILNKALGKNFITTSKYNMFTFIPLNLMSQFSKAANIYFLIISYMQTIKQISISAGIPTQSAPLASVMFASMCKDGYEDYKKYKNDQLENKQSAMRLDPKTREWKEVHWKDIVPGDVLLIKQDQQIPADVIILNTSEEKGVCYIETKSLDGETNLKMKTAEQQLSSLFKNENAISERLVGEILCEKPNNAIYKFEGNIKLWHH